jgi:integrase
MAKKRGNNEGTISKRGDGRYMARMTIGRNPVTGKPKRVTFYGHTREEVAEKLAKALHDKSRDTFIAPHRLTLGGWLDTWLWQYKKPKVRPTTFDTYESHIRRHLKPGLGNVPLKTFRPERIQAYLNAMAKQGFDASTLRLNYIILSNALKQAEKNGLVARNVARLVDPPRQQRKEYGTLTIAQVRSRLLPAIEGDRLQPALLTFFMAGLRKGELLALRWIDVDFDAKTLQVKQTLARVGTHTPGAPAKPDSSPNHQRRAPHSAP